MWLASDYKVSAVFGTADKGLLKLDNIDDFASGIIKLRSGIALQIDLSWSSHHKPSWKIDIYGDKGGASLSPNKVDHENFMLFRLENSELKRKHLSKNFLKITNEKSLQEHVVSCIKRNVASDCSAENAYAVLETILRWYESA
jgi:predicted dehydrogenase